MNTFSTISLSLKKASGSDLDVTARKSYQMKLDCYSTSSFRVFLGTFVSTSACIALWLLTDLYDIAGLPEEQRVWSFLINDLVPLLTAGPFFYLLFRRMQGMSVDRLALEKLASTDPLTAVLNRGAFTMLVEAYLEEARVFDPRF